MSVGSPVGGGRAEVPAAAARPGWSRPLPAAPPGRPVATATQPSPPAAPAGHSGASGQLLQQGALLRAYLHLPALLLQRRQLQVGGHEDAADVEGAGAPLRLLHRRQQDVGAAVGTGCRKSRRV